MSPSIRVFVHVACMNHYREIVSELEEAVDRSGLSECANVLWNWSNPALFEYPTLRVAHGCAMADAGSIVGYIHTKGAGTPHKRLQRDSWRRYLIHHVIHRWRECVERLQSCDVVGTDYRLDRNGDEPHFCGNFWWARAAYLATLPTPGPTLTKRHPRMGAEAWVLSNPEARWSEIAALPGFDWENGVAPTLPHHGMQPA